MVLVKIAKYVIGTCMAFPCLVTYLNQENIFSFHSTRKGKNMEKSLFVLVDKWKHVIYILTNFDNG